MKSSAFVHSMCRSGLVALALVVQVCLAGLPGCGGAKAQEETRSEAVIETTNDAPGEVVKVGEGIQTTRHLTPRERAKDK